MSNPETPKPTPFPHLAILLMVTWTLLVLISIFWNLGNQRDHAVSLAMSEARSNWNKDQAIRNWATRHGGIYVRPDERTPPNPYLEFLPDRDLTTTDGRTLTLMNPAYMMRQMTEEFEQLYGIKAKITGKVLLNPANKADPWEFSALSQIEQGVDEVIEITSLEGEEYVRLMRPMYMIEGCEKCHSHLGFKKGDLRGGVSISVPLTKYLNAEDSNRKFLVATHGGIWLLGVFAIGFMSFRGRQREAEQKQAQEALRQTEERYKSLFENSEVSIWHEDLTDVYRTLERLRHSGIVDIRAYLEAHPDVTLQIAKMVKVVRVNQASLRVFNAMGRDDFLNRIDNSFGPESLKVFIEEMCAIWNKEKFFRSEINLKKQNGEPLEAILSFRIPEHEEDFKNVPITIIDITDRKLAEMTLEKSEERFRTLYHQSPMGVSLEDYSQVKVKIDELKDQGVSDFYTFFKDHPDILTETIKCIRLVAANDTQLSMYAANTFEDYLRFDSDQADGHTQAWLDFYNGEISAFARGDHTFSKEVPDDRADGSAFLVHCITRIVEGREDDWSEVISTHEDITERKQFEDQARRAQKMEAVGQLSGGIAHDFNNILGVVLGNLEIIQRLTPDDEKIQGRVATALRGARRGAELTRKLLGFSRREAHGSTLISINDLIMNLDDLIAKSLTVEISIDHSLENELWPVNVDPGDLQDSILNIGLNARDAMPSGGFLTIKTENRVLDTEYTEQNPGSRPGEFIMLALTDTGEGMAPEIRERAMEPFFTTKEETRGSGLGLSMVYGFVQRSGGFVTLESEPGDGTTVCLFLPRAYQTPESGNSPLEDTVLPSGDETILVVDDEKDLVEIAVTYLEDLGYKTLTAPNGKEALQVLQKNTGIHLLFSDVILPGALDGYQLAIAARKAHPGLKVLLTSGFARKKETAPKAEKKEYEDLSRTLLHKPYSSRDLALAVRQILDEEY